MGPANDQSLAESGFIQRLSDSKAIVVKESSMDHKFQFSIAQTAAALSAIHQHGQLIALAVFDEDVRIDGVIVARHWLVDGVIERLSKIDFSFQSLAAVRVGVEFAIVDQIRRQSTDYFFPNSISE